MVKGMPPYFYDSTTDDPLADLRILVEEELKLFDLPTRSEILPKDQLEALKEWLDARLAGQ